MVLQTWRFITLILAVLTVGLAFCHSLELPAKLQYDGSLYLTLQNSLYRSFGTIGAGIEVSTLLAAAVLAVLLRKRRPAFMWTMIGTACVAVALAIWFVFIAPVNAEFRRLATASLPADWTRLRDQWEYGHAARFALQLVGLNTFVLSVLSEQPPLRVTGTRDVVDCSEGGVKRRSASADV